MMKNVSLIGNKTQELPAQIILGHRVVLIIERIQLLCNLEIKLDQQDRF